MTWGNPPTGIPSLGYTFAAVKRKVIRAAPLIRRKSVDKIDGAIATLMAFSQAYRATAPDPNAGEPPAVFLV